MKNYILTLFIPTLLILAYYSCQVSNENPLIGKWKAVKVANSCEDNSEFSRLFRESVGLTYEFTKDGKNLTFDPAISPSHYDDTYKLSEDEIRTYRNEQLLTIYEIMHLKGDLIKMKLKLNHQNKKCAISFLFTKLH